MKGRTIFPGKTQGVALVSQEPVSFYGGIDVTTGIVIEKGHELEGQCVKDKIFVFPQGKGSTVGSYVLYGLKKNGLAPKAIIKPMANTIHRAVRTKKSSNNRDVPGTRFMPWRIRPLKMPETIQVAIRIPMKVRMFNPHR